MLINLRRKRAQSLVIVALSATALFGIIALGLDAGRLYFQRRDVQNAADAGALAGAQALLPTGFDQSVTTAMITAAGCEASVYALQNLLDVPVDGSCTPTPSPAYTPASLGAGITERAAKISATVQVWTPSRNNSNEIHVRVTYNVPLTFASVLGFTTSAVMADAYAHGGFFNNTYTVFGFSATGSGNSIFDDQSGYAQVDDGYIPTGADLCNPDPTRGKMVSNAKFHVPNPVQPGINLNGEFFYAQASDTHGIITFWNGSVSPSTSNVEPVPNYEAPLQPTYQPPQGGTPTTINGTPAIQYSPGLYTHDITIPRAGYSLYQFQNGVYEFLNANLTISGGTVGNLQDPRNRQYTTFSDGFTGGISDLPAAPDGTNGVEFVFDGNSSFSATSPKSGGGPSIFFVAPSFVSSGTDMIAFYVKGTDTINGPNGTPWSETMTGGSFQIYGTVFNDDNNGSNGTIAALTGVSSVGGTNPTNEYADTGEFISPQANLYNGNLATESSLTLSTPCPPPPGHYQQNPASLLVQFSPHYVPHFRGLAYLVK
jgi:Flp pilus assembly protein TadG